MDWGWHRGLNWRNPGFQQPDTHPVVCVSWYDAVTYCNWLSMKHGLEPVYTGKGDDTRCYYFKNGYRLPTEAEWEYACRAGSSSLYSFGNNREELEAHGWYSSNSEFRTQPVGQKRPNAFGLHDMHGNVWEWCWDWYSEYPLAEIMNPRGPRVGSYRAIRGGSMFCAAIYCRSALRNQLSPGGRMAYLGFRVVRNIPVEDK